MFCVEAVNFDYCKYMKYIDCSIRKDPFRMCGSDGLTYPSKCEFILAHCKNPTIGLVHEGECATEVVPPSTMVPDSFCRNIVKQTCHGVRPICGTNGVTYNNDCEFEKAKCWDPNIHIKKIGSC